LVGGEEKVSLGKGGGLTVRFGENRGPKAKKTVLSEAGWGGGSRGRTMNEARRGPSAVSAKVGWLINIFEVSQIIIELAFEMGAGGSGKPLQVPSKGGGKRTLLSKEKKKRRKRKKSSFLAKGKGDMVT